MVRTVDASAPETVFDEIDSALENLREKGAKKCVILWCNPHNPLGRVWRREELEKLVKVVVKHGDFVTAVCSDEVWSGMVLDDDKTPFTSLAKCAFQNNVVLRDRLVLLTSPSKTYNVAALDFAFAVVPNDHLRRRYFRHGRDQAECTPFGLAAAEAIFLKGGCEKRGDVLTPENGQCETWRLSVIDYLRSNRDLAIDFITTHCDPHIKIAATPEASYLLWLDGNGLDIPHLADFLRDNYNIALSDGSPFFGKPDSRFLRLNFACERDLLIKALNRLKTAVDDYRAQHGTSKAANYNNNVR